jgi:hypothetical protein
MSNVLDALMALLDALGLVDNVRLMVRRWRRKK